MKHIVLCIFICGIMSSIAWNTDGKENCTSSENSESSDGSASKPQEEQDRDSDEYNFCCGQALEAFFDCWHLSEHAKPGMHNYPDEPVNKTCPEWMTPCCMVGFLGADTIYCAACLGLLADAYCSQDRISDQCGIGGACGAVGCTAGCNDANVSGFCMPTAACLNVTCAAGADRGTPTTGLLGCGVSCGNCGIVRADQYSLGAYLGCLRQSLYACGRELSCNVIECCINSFCRPENE